MVEEDLQRIGLWVTQQSEALHTRLSKLLANCSDESYPVDYLRGAPLPRSPPPLQLRSACAQAAC